VLPKSGSWLEAKMRRVLANTFGEVWATALGSVVGRISPVRKLCSSVSLSFQSGKARLANQPVNQ
jgi:hypothetical protein